MSDTPPTPRWNSMSEADFIPRTVYRELLAETESLRQELEITNKLLYERGKVLKAIPECPEHGECVPHAIEWIDRAKLLIYDSSEKLEAENETLRKMLTEARDALLGDSYFNQYATGMRLHKYLNSE